MQNINVSRDIADMKKRPYTRELKQNADGSWFARVLEFPGCMTEGDTEAEALANLEDAMESWIEVTLEERGSVPDPLANDDFSGKFLVRVPKSLHRDLTRKAEAENVSLNQFVLSTLARSI